MAMTAAVKDEISRLPVTRTCCRKAEVSAILRFAGGLHLVSGRIVIEAELDTAMAARRLCRLPSPISQPPCGRGNRIARNTFL